MCSQCQRQTTWPNQTWILSILQKQKQHVSVMGSNTWLKMGLMPFHIYAYNGVWLWYISLPVKWQEQSNCSCLCICASQMILCSDFAKSMSLPCTSKNTLRFLILVKQKFDRLLFFIICHGTYPVFWCLSPQVLDQSYLRPKNFISFLSYNVDSWWFWQTVWNNFCYTWKVIWYKRKNMKLDIAINYVCSWLFLMSVHWSMS